MFFMSGYPASGSMAPVTLPDDADFIAKPVDYEALALLLVQRLGEGKAKGRKDHLQQWITPKGDDDV